MDNGWGPEERLPMFDMIKDGFCSNPQMSCTSMPAVDANGCTETNGVRLCSSDMPPSPHSSIDPLCQKAQVSAECSYYKGNMECYTDAKGVQRCPTNEGGISILAPSMSRTRAVALSPRDALKAQRAKQVRVMRSRRFGTAVTTPATKLS